MVRKQMPSETKEDVVVVQVPYGAELHETSRSTHSYWSSSRALKMARGEAHELLSNILRALIER